MNVLEIQKAIQELSPAEIIDLSKWVKTQLPWYEREPHKSRIEAGIARAEARPFEETDLDEFERRVLGQTLAEFEEAELQRA
jgi:hypothetical protein